MGRAIVRDPQVFLFDEPLSNLDAKLRVAMRTEIKALHQRLKTTTVYVTHDQIEAMTMADQIVVMHDGIVEQIGAPLDSTTVPANLFVAGFIGSPAMNLLEGRIDGDGFARSATAPAGGRPRPLRPGGRPFYGIRPEHFRLTGEGIAGRGHRRRADRRRRPRSSPRLAARRSPRVQRAPSAFAPGRDDHTHADAEAIHLFDAETGAALTERATPVRRPGRSEKAASEQTCNSEET